MGSDAARFCEERLRCADRCDSVPIHEKALDYYEVDGVSTDPFPNCRSAWKQGRAWLTGRPSQKLWTRNELTRMKAGERHERYECRSSGPTQCIVRSVDRMR